MDPEYDPPSRNRYAFFLYCFYAFGGSDQVGHSHQIETGGGSGSPGGCVGRIAMRWYYSVPGCPGSLCRVQKM